MPQFNESIPVPKAPHIPFSRAERRTPEFAGQAVGAVVLMTAVLGILGGAAALLIILGCSADLRVAVRFGAIGWGITTGALIVFWLRRDRAVSLMYSVETIIGQDVNRDGMTGPPSIHYNLPLAPGHWIRGRLTVSDDVLHRWCEAAKDGRSLSIGAWKAEFALPDGTSGRGQYELFVNELDEQGLIERIGGNVGIRLSPSGWQFVESVLMASGPTPLLERRVGIED